MNTNVSAARSERLTVLLTRDEKRRLAALAKERRISIGELVRTAVSRATENRSDAPWPTAAQARALEEAAASAVASLQRADAALSRAESELAKTRAYFDSQPGEVREPEFTPRGLLARALARTIR